MKKILITNDDGVFAEGIYEIARELSEDYDVTVVAPNVQKSGAGQSITFRSELYLEEVKLNGLEKVKAYSVTGTPADCVKFAIGNIGVRPDLVISGINLGANLGTDVWYSGTLGAATEAALMGYPSLALSVTDHNAAYVRDAAHACREAVDFYIKNNKICDLLSVNVPNLPLSEMKDVRIATLSKRNYPLAYKQMPDGGFAMPDWDFHCDENNTECDEYLLMHGHITWTPVMIDRCAYDRLKPLDEKFKEWKCEK